MSREEFERQFAHLEGEAKELAWAGWKALADRVPKYPNRGEYLMLTLAVLLCVAAGWFQVR